MSDEAQEDRNLTKDDFAGWQRLPALWTLYYLCFALFFLIILSKEGAICVKSLSLNELGDFLAGFLAPVGIIWIVASFLQQGKDFQNSITEQSKAAGALLKQIEVQERQIDISQKSFNERYYPIIAPFNPRVLQSSDFSTTEKLNILIDFYNAGEVALDISVNLSTPNDSFHSIFYSISQTLKSAPLSFGRPKIKANPNPMGTILNVCPKGNEFTFETELKLQTNSKRNFGDIFGSHEYQLRVKFYDSLRREYDQKWKVSFSSKGEIFIKELPPNSHIT